MALLGHRKNRPRAIAGKNNSLFKIKMTDSVLKQILTLPLLVLSVIELKK
jgi:hypothetical protein